MVLNLFQNQLLELQCRRNSSGDTSNDVFCYSRSALVNISLRK